MPECFNEGNPSVVEVRNNMTIRSGAFRVANTNEADPDPDMIIAGDLILGLCGDLDVSGSLDESFSCEPMADPDKIEVLVMGETLTPPTSPEVEVEEYRLCGAGEFSITLPEIDPKYGMVIRWSNDEFFGSLEPMGARSPVYSLRPNDSRIVYVQLYDTISFCETETRAITIVATNATDDPDLCGRYEPATFNEIPSIPNLQENRSEFFFDLNLDGFDDFVVMNLESEATTLYLHTGQFEANGLPIFEAQPITLPFDINGRWQAADIDGNGLPDLLWQIGQNLRVYLNITPNPGKRGATTNFEEATEDLCVVNPFFDEDLDEDQLLILDANSNGDLDLASVTVGSGTPPVKVIKVNSNSSKGSNAVCEPIEDLCGGQDIISDIPNEITPLMKPFDFDNDGDIDLLVLMYDPTLPDNEHALRLYENLGNNNFTLRSGTGLVSVHRNGFATIFDYNGDGWLDILTGSTGTLPNRLHQNMGDGTFVDVSDVFNSKKATGDEFSREYVPGNYVNASAVDVDNDGDLDVYWHGLNENDTARLFLNSPNGFIQVEGLNYTQTAPGGTRASWSDVDNDGDMDVYVYRGGVGQQALLLRNNITSAGASNYLRLRLEGCESGLDPQGARVEVRAGNIRCTQVYGSRFSSEASASNVLHFGMAAESTAQVTVHWPGSSTPTVMENVTANQVMTIQQDPGCCDPLSRLPEQVDANSPLFVGYPNPATQVYTVQTKQPDTYSLRLLNTHGQVVYEARFNGTRHTLPTSTLAKGVYSVQLRSAAAQAVQRVVVQ